MLTLSVEMSGNEKSGLRADTIYAMLHEENGGVYMSATLDFVLKAIRDRKLEVKGVTVMDTSRGSKVVLDYYSKPTMKKEPSLEEWNKGLVSP